METDTLGLVAEVVDLDVSREGPEIWLLASAHPRGGAWLREQLRCVLSAVALAERSSPAEVWRSLEPSIPSAPVWGGVLRPRVEQAREEALSAAAAAEVGALLASVPGGPDAEPVDVDPAHAGAVHGAMDASLLLSEAGTPEAVDLLEGQLVFAAEVVARAHGQSPLAVLDLFHDRVPSDEEWETGERQALDEWAAALVEAEPRGVGRG